MNTVLVTGAAGFIGMHACARLLARGDTVVGIDNLNTYYDPALKEARLARLLPHPNFRFERLDIVDRQALPEVFARVRPTRVLHLAAQAGVRYSIDQPHAYVDANLAGFVNLLEACRAWPVEHLVYASSSSVYGGNTRLPFSEADAVDHPISLYAATKKSNELMAHTYSHLFQLPTTGLRFFTVYGPWGRPDMALFKFTRAILQGEPIKVFGYGQHKRDFTYIDDIVEGVIRVLDRPAPPDPAWDSKHPDPASSSAPWRVYNIGNNQPVVLLDYIAALEQAIGKKADMELLPPQPGDLHDTFADVSELTQEFDYKPATPVTEGVKRFVEWYRGFYGT